MYFKYFEKRIKRQRDFFSSNRPGEILFCRSTKAVYYGLPWIELLMEEPVEKVVNKKDTFIEKINRKYMEDYRDCLKDFFNIEDDGLPTLDIHFGAGTMTAPMFNGKVRFSGLTCWADEIIKDWDDVNKLIFNPDDPWINLYRSVYRDLLNRWEGDFLTVPFYYRSPLDTANGLRGNEIFIDMYENEDLVEYLVNWSVEWIVWAERQFNDGVAVPEGFEKGVWEVLLPKTGIFLNGDVIDLISGELELKYEKPALEKLCEKIEGVFYHHHSMGLRQSYNVSDAKGLFVQNIYTDQGTTPHPFEVILSDQKEREKIISASLTTPVQLTGDFYPYIDKLLPVIKNGRFILWQQKNDINQTKEMLEKINKVRNNI